MELFERIKQVIATCTGGNQSAFVRKINESMSTFNGYLSVDGQDRIKVRTIRQILVIFRVDANWLLTGEGTMFRSASPSLADQSDPISQRVDHVARAMRDAGVDEMKILAAARDMLEGEMAKLARERGQYGAAEPKAGVQKAAEDQAQYTGAQKAAGDDSV